MLFFLLFLPRFVDVSRGHMPWQLGLLGYFSGSVGAWINRKPQVGKWLDRMAGTVFIGLGIRMMMVVR